jgi:predicted DNA-binding transcriptional regulator AlpA
MNSRKADPTHKIAGQRENAASDRLCRLMSASQLAEFLGVSLSWVNKAHVYGNGPKATRIGRRRLYDPLDVESWLATRKQQSTSEPA